MKEEDLLQKLKKEYKDMLYQQWDVLMKKLHGDKELECLDSAEYDDYLTEHYGDVDSFVDDCLEKE